MDSILQSRFDLIRDEPFFGVPLMELDIVPDKSVPMMATNGTDLKVNPEWAASAEPRRIRTILAHEVLHCGLLHHIRMGKRDLSLWNRAADFAVNAILQTYNVEMMAKRGFAPLDLSNLLLDAKYDGMSAEEIYNLLADDNGNNEGDGEGDGDSSAPSDPTNSSDPSDSPGLPRHSPWASPGGVEPASAAESGEPTDLQEEEAKWRVTMDHAEKAATMRGQMPGGTARALKDLLKPELPWPEILRQFLRDCAKDDFSWRRPSKAGLANRMLLPGLHSPRMGEIVVAIDTSGSVDDTLLKRFLSEIASIHAEIRPTKLIVIDCDARINTVAEFGPEDVFDFQPAGGGGTRFEPVFEYVEENNISPVALIYFTDLCGSFPQEVPPYPVLWLDYDGYSTPPFGEHIPVRNPVKP